MEAATQQFDRANEGIRGIRVKGRTPKGLELSDGTSLALESETGTGGRAEWRRLLPEDKAEVRGSLSVDDALRLAGDDFAEYVRVRTRSEVEWLHVLAEWAREQAGRLEADLDQAGYATT